MLLLSLKIREKKLEGVYFGLRRRQTEHPWLYRHGYRSHITRTNALRFSFVFSIFYIMRLYLAAPSDKKPLHLRLISVV